MAKAKRRVSPRSDPRRETAAASTPENVKVAAAADQPVWVDWCRNAAAAIFGGTLVYLAYYPSDSVQVERGDALWFGVFALLLWTTVFAAAPFRDGWLLKAIPSIPDRSLFIDLLAWLLAIWMVIAALASGPPGNLRQATNEAWFWIAAAAFFTAARRLLVDRSARVAGVTLLLAITVAMAVHALHQQWISLPQLRADYLADPDAMLQAAGIAAPKDSAARMVFANRLLDGGPTATFALANSLAAVLVVCVIVPLAELRRRGVGVLRRPGGVILMVIAAVGATALLSTRSRSAIGACLLGIAWLMFFGGTGAGDSAAKPGPFSHLGGSLSRRLIAAIALVLVSIGLLTLGIVLLGDNEWMAAAPASLQFRLQYWKSTLAMVIDHPVFGAGPGGFQAMYLGYRLPVARESIADPHNFFFETMASGGVPAAGLLIALVVCCVRFGRRRVVAVEQEADAPGASLGVWIFGGAAVALALIWLFAWLSRQLPDVQASLFAVPAGIGVGWWFHRQANAPHAEGNDGRMLRSAVTAILIAVMIHLLVAGGWTVPGVAVVVWLAAAMLTAASVPRTVEASADQTDSFDGPSRSLRIDDRVRKRAAAAAFVVGAVLVLTLRFGSIVPVQHAAVALARAEDALRRGMPPRVDTESAAAVAADPWDHQAALWRSEWLKNRMLVDNDAPRLRSLWQQAAETARQRAAKDPLVMRSLADQALQLHQRYGRPDDLQTAWQGFQAAVAENPTDESLVAQAAIVADQLGERDRAESLADRAVELSALGDNIVRDLGLVHVLSARPVGAAAAAGPVWVSVKPEFQQRFGLIVEP